MTNALKQNRRSQFFYQTLFRLSIVSTLFLLISVGGLAFQTWLQVRTYGWFYDQTVIINNVAVTTTIYLKSQAVFVGWLAFIGLVQLMQFLFIRSALNAKE